MRRISTNGLHGAPEAVRYLPAASQEIVLLSRNESVNGNCCGRNHKASACCTSNRWNITQAIAVFWP
jgi:hypothetical protein